MSADGPGREVAHRLFAAEYEDATLSHAESDEERAPTYVVAPTGARINRLFVVGTLTEVTRVNEDMVRARVVDPTGAFVVYAGQYQPDELATLEDLDPPAFVAVTGKARTFEPEDGDRIYSSIRPESIATVDGPTRDRWVVDAARQTLDRVSTIAAAAETGQSGDSLREALVAGGIDAGLASGVTLALAHYETTSAYLEAVRALAIDAVRVVAEERPEVRPLEIGPSDRADGTATYASLAGDRSIPATVESSAPDTAEEPDAATSSDQVGGVSPGEESSSDPGPEEPTTPQRSGESAEELEAESPSEVASADPDPASTGAESDAAPEERPTKESPPDEDAVEATSTEEPAETDEAGTPETVIDEDDPYELDDDARASIEEEYGAEFASGSDLEELSDETPADTDPAEPPDQSPDDTPKRDHSVTQEVEPSSDTAGADAQPEADPEPADQSASTDGSADAEGDEAPSESVDLESAVLEAMTELDDGDGAARSAIVSAVSESTDADEGAIADALEDALMDGLCYEPAEDRFTAI